MTKDKLHFSIVFLTLSIFCLSCHDNGTIKAELDYAESIMETAPDEALARLRSIDRSELRDKRMTAKFSLLYSMALDKNYIDLQSDSIIAPAVKYYNHHGTAEEKLLTNFYLGIIYQNDSRYDEAMECFINAEQYGKQCTNPIAKGRLYSAMTWVYRKVFDDSQALETAILTADYFKQANDSTKYFNAILNLAALYLERSDSSALDYIRILEANSSVLNDSQKLSLRLARLDYLVFFKKKDEIRMLLPEYVNDFEQTGKGNWYTIANAYYCIGEYESAYDAMARNEQLSVFQSSDFWLKAEICKHLGLFQECAEAYDAYYDITHENHLNAISSDVKYTEERYHNMLVKQRKTYVIIILCLCILLGSVLFVLSIRQFRRVKEQHKQQAEAARIELDKAEKERLRIEKERDEVRELYDNVKEEVRQLQRARKSTVLSKGVRQIIDERLDVLNKFLSAHLSHNYSFVPDNEMKAFTEDRKRFLDSTRFSFIVAHPEFLRYLKMHDLSDEEISYCCLYCIGLNGSEIADYLCNSSFYKVSSAIRKKLGVVKINIDKFLLAKMAELD